MTRKFRRFVDRKFGALNSKIENEMNYEMGLTEFGIVYKNFLSEKDFLQTDFYCWFFSLLEAYKYFKMILEVYTFSHRTF